MSYLKHLPTCQCSSCNPHLPEPFTNPTPRILNGRTILFHGIILKHRMWYVVTEDGMYIAPEFWEGLPYA